MNRRWRAHSDYVTGLNQNGYQTQSSISSEEPSAACIATARIYDECESNEKKTRHMIIPWQCPSIKKKYMITNIPKIRIKCNCYTVQKIHNREHTKKAAAAAATKFRWHNAKWDAYMKKTPFSEEWERCFKELNTNVTHAYEPRAMRRIMTLFPDFVTMDFNERAFRGPETDYATWIEHGICLMGTSDGFFFVICSSIRIEISSHRFTIKMDFCLWSFVVYSEESKFFFDL